MFISLASAYTCYQESPNTFNQSRNDTCLTMNYSFGWNNFTDVYYASHLNKTYAYDGNLTSFAMQNNNEIAYEAWYPLNKSLNYTSNSRWLVKSDDTVSNLSIGLGYLGAQCIDYGRSYGYVGFKIYRSGITMSASYYCYNASGWQVMTTNARGKTGYKLYEERMLWDISGDINPPSSDCWSKTNNILYIPKGCTYNLLRGLFGI